MFHFPLRGKERWHPLQQCHSSMGIPITFTVKHIDPKIYIYIFESLSCDSNPGLLTSKPGLIPLRHATSFYHSLNPNESLVFKDNEKIFHYVQYPAHVVACSNEISTTAFLWKYYLWIFRTIPLSLKHIPHFSQTLLIPFSGRLKLLKVMLPMSKPQEK